MSDGLISRKAAGLAVAKAEVGYYDGISGDWHPYPGPTILSNACAAIRALPDHATQLAAALRLPEVAAMVREAKDAAALLENVGMWRPVLDAALSALDAHHDPA